jgi:hypothetical protein
MTDRNRRLLKAVMTALLLTVSGGLFGSGVLYRAAALVILGWRKRYWEALAILAFILVPPLLLPMTVRYCTRVYDAELWRLDDLLHMNLQPYAMQAFANSHLLRASAGAVYTGCILAIALAVLFSRRAGLFAARLISATALGYATYFLVPACGPYYYVNGITATALRNCVPSLHMTWALLIWADGRSFSLPARLLADTYVLLTIVATIGSGEHYVIDLIVAAPFTWAIHWAAGRIAVALRASRVSDNIQAETSAA